MTIPTKDLLPENPCDIFKDFPSTSDTTTKIAWLKRNFPDEVDATYYDCILKRHSSTPEVFQKGILDYISDNSNLIATTFSIEYIRALYEDEDINYDYFVSFEVNKRTNQIEATLTTDFLTDTSNKTAPTSYSIPLFESIFAKFGAVDLVFAKVLLDGAEDVLFVVKGVKTGFYDYSEDPS